MRSTVACCCFITGQRLNIHVEICDKKGKINIWHLPTLFGHVNKKHDQTILIPILKTVDTIFRWATTSLAFKSNCLGNIKQQSNGGEKSPEVKLTWSDLFVKGNVGPLVQLKYKRDINIKDKWILVVLYWGSTSYFQYSWYPAPYKQKNYKQTNKQQQYNRSPDRVSTAIRCHKATGSQCASVAGTFLFTKKWHDDEFGIVTTFLHTFAAKKIK